MKTASLGLLEVPVVRENAGGDPPRTPPLLVTSRTIVYRTIVTSVFLQEKFLANERELFLAVKVWPLPGPILMSSTCKHVRTGERGTGDRGQGTETQQRSNENGFARAFGGAVVHENAGGDPPRTPPLLVTSRPIPLSLCFNIFLAERENTFGGLVTSRALCW